MIKRATTKRRTMKENRKGKSYTMNRLMRRGVKEWVRHWVVFKEVWLDDERQEIIKIPWG